MREKVVLSTIKRKAMRFPCVVGARQMSGPGQLRMGPERGLGLGLGCCCWPGVDRRKGEAEVLTTTRTRRQMRKQRTPQGQRGRDE